MNEFARKAMELAEEYATQVAEYITGQPHTHDAARSALVAYLEGAEQKMQLGEMALNALHYWNTDYTGAEPSESIFQKMSMEALCGPFAPPEVIGTMRVSLWPTGLEYDFEPDECWLSKVPPGEHRVFFHPATPTEEQP